MSWRMPTKHNTWINVSTMLVHRPRRWTSIKPTEAELFVFAGDYVWKEDILYPCRFQRFLATQAISLKADKDTTGNRRNLQGIKENIKGWNQQLYYFKIKFITNIKGWTSVGTSFTTAHTGGA